MQHYPHRHSDVSRAHLCKLSPLSTSSQNIQTYRIQRESKRATGLYPPWTFLRRQRKSRASSSVPGDHHKSEDQKFIISVIEKQKAVWSGGPLDLDLGKGKSGTSEKQICLVAYKGS
jgi:hypothetical protein